MTSASGVFQRKPFKSGDSLVIAVTGIPLFSSNDNMNLKPMQINGKDCILMSSYKEMSLAEMEELDNNISTESDSSLKHLATQRTAYGLAQVLSEMDIDLSDNQELVLSIKESG